LAAIVSGTTELLPEVGVAGATIGEGVAVLGASFGFFPKICLGLSFPGQFTLYSATIKQSALLQNGLCIKSNVRQTYLLDTGRKFKAAVSSLSRMMVSLLFCTSKAAVVLLVVAMGLAFYCVAAAPSPTLCFLGV
jgi:hypothetical protein